MRANPGPIISMEGQLQKQRRLKTWAWKSYFFVLEDDQFCYYKDSSKSSSRGLIDLAQAQSVRMTGVACKGFPFEIITHTRSHLLAAPSAQLREQWLKQLQQAMVVSFRRSASASMHRPSCDSISEDELPEEVLNELRRLGEQGATNQQQATIQAQASEQRQSGYSNIYEEISSAGRAAESRASRMRALSSTSGDDDEVFPSDGARGRRNHHSGCSFESSNSTSGSVSSGDVEDRTDNRDGVPSFPPIPELPHPRLELTYRTAFDDIRLFLANNRRPDEVFPTPRRAERGGKAIERLKNYLDTLDQDYS